LVQARSRFTTLPQPSVLELQTMVAAVSSAIAISIVFTADAFRVRHAVKKAESGSGVCADPASAIVNTMECITNKDSSCADQGYSDLGFFKYHNSIRAVLPPFPAATYWSTAMKYATFTTWPNFHENVGENQAEVRYIKNINMSDGSDFGLEPSSTYPFRAHIKQYEWAIVTVDADCKIVRWDQYGDNKEQSDADSAMNAMIDLVGIQPALAQQASSSSKLVSRSTLAEVDESSGRVAETSGKSRCADPLRAIIHTLTCITNKNSTCANEGYNWFFFRKYHNGKETGIRLWPIDIYWSMAMKFSTFTLDYDFTRNVDPSHRNGRASVRYIETVDLSDGTDFELPPSSVYPFNSTVIQYEHALVEVDDDCKMTRWDQYGDDQEQVDVDVAMEAFMADQGIKCALSMDFPWNCP